MPRWILARFVRWRCLGQEVDDERAQQRRPGLHQDASLLGIQAARGPGPTLRFRFVSQKTGLSAHHHPVGGPVGATQSKGAACRVGTPTDVCPWFCSVLDCHGPGNGNTRLGLDAASTPTGTTPFLPRGGDSASATSRPTDGWAARYDV